ncbi:MULTISPECIES: lipopolysaccharide assembly protein LapB [Cyanophyceae]|uniref:tetratricopeptide repeat protein n=1 Tax=Cyanophyceae TaxID=3028117 RepID=UPI0002EDE403|nr:MULTISPECIES: tetratricopeptide repeat protein [Cyanophyceae]SMH50886.1 Tetratricopeptide repeat-containing protein [Picosynechococcus sp. OG1]SMQ81932.1 Tetratricopeptide repeat-containing protein [Synechococcus sp. 7002]
MASHIIEKYYRPRPWVYGLSGLLFLLAGGLLVMPRFDQWMLARQTAAAAKVQPATTPDPAIALLEKDQQSYEIWLEKEPNNEKALRGLLDTSLKLNDLEKTATALDGLAQIHRDNPDYLVLLGQVEQEAKDYEGAAATYKKVLLTDPTHINALQGMVDLLLVQNRPEGAIELLQTTLKDMGQLTEDETIDIDPEKVTSIQLMLGQIYVAQKRFGEAIAIYDQAATVNKTDFRPVLAKAMVLKNQGNEAAAKPFFMTAINLAPATYKDQIKEMAVLSAADLKALEAVPTETDPEAEATE